MKRLLLSLASIALALCAPLAHAEEGEQLLAFHGSAKDTASVQRGARDFMNYCSGCHSMKYLRYNRMGQDLGIPEDLLKTDLMFTSDKPGDVILSALPPASEQWFGRVPPDLSLEAKSRGTDWIYTYLQSFYLDDKRPLGVNNVLLPGVSMPHVLGELQGWQKLDEHKNAEAEKGKTEEETGPRFELIEAGQLSPEEYKKFVTDLTNFMTYAAEPVGVERVDLGIKVMLFLAVLLILTYLLKQEFWRDIH
jgi:ubiquinol-cytochrome c reductase cytochrome c1 subunit